MKVETFVEIRKGQASNGDVHYRVLGINKDITNTNHNYFGDNNICISYRVANTEAEKRLALELSTYDAIRLLKFIGKTSNELVIYNLNVDEESVVDDTIKLWGFE